MKILPKIWTNPGDPTGDAVASIDPENGNMVIDTLSTMAVPHVVENDTFAYNRTSTYFRDGIHSFTFNPTSADGAATFSQRIILPTSTPASASTAGVAGTVTWDASYIHACAATNTWKRVAIATW